MAENYLRTLAEPVPGWIEDFREGEPFPRNAFFGSRVVYYPGAGDDGSAVRLFNSTHSCHCFVYVDYAVGQAKVEGSIGDPVRRFRGYDPVVRLHLPEEALTPRGWRPRVLPAEPPRMIFGRAQSFGLLVIFERQPGFVDSHGARRFAMIFLAADGFAAYEALFCRPPRSAPPFVVVIQDHGFGGNYDRFGCGGHLERIARELSAYPRFLWSAEESWEGYSRVPGAGAAMGGMHGNARFLYSRD